MTRSQPDEGRLGVGELEGAGEHRGHVARLATTATAPQEAATHALTLPSPPLTVIHGRTVASSSSPWLGRTLGGS